MDIENGNKPENNRCRFSMCTFPWYAVTILWDGKVVPCPQDWFAEMLLGDLNNESLETIWNKNPVFKLRTRMVHQNLQDILCEKCDRPWRKQFLGIPAENASTFLKEHILGYKTLKTK
jgi:radical SAM protein with 4Fe4S-binding SPASM domain